MFILEHLPGRSVFADNNEYLFFSGYSYLGMSHVPAFVELVKQGIDKYGILFPSSRISNTRLDVFNEMESLLSQLTSQEETVIFSSGFLSGRAVVEMLAAKKENCFAAPATHPAIKKNAIELNDNWQEDFIQIIQNTSRSEIVLLADSVNPLKATITDFTFLRKAKSNVTITCIIDDSHRIGLPAETDNGIRLYLPNLPNLEYVFTYSLSKAFHLNGGAVSCSKKIADLLRQSSFYTATTTIAPSLCYAFVKGQQVYNQQKQKLQYNLKTFQSLLHNCHITSHPRLPIFVLPQSFDQDYFTPYNIIISSFSYPDPAGKKINRLVISSLHTKEDLETVAATLNK